MCHPAAHRTHRKVPTDNGMETGQMRHLAAESSLRDEATHGGEGAASQHARKPFLDLVQGTRPNRRPLVYDRPTRSARYACTGIAIDDELRASMLHSSRRTVSATALVHRRTAANVRSRYHQ